MPSSSFLLAGQSAAAREGAPPAGPVDAMEFEPAWMPVVVAGPAAGPLRRDAAASPPPCATGAVPDVLRRSVPVTSDCPAGTPGISPELRRSADPADPLGGQRVPAAVMDVLRRSRGRGNPLPADVGSGMSRQFGMDLSAVRIHRDQNADNLTRSVQATAFTHGSDIYFSQGSYAPGSAGGRRLLAHELAHVTAGEQATPGGAVIGRANDPAETQADQTADRVMTGLSTANAADTPGTPPATPPGAARDAAPIARTIRRRTAFLGKKVDVAYAGETSNLVGDQPEAVARVAERIKVRAQVKKVLDENGTIAQAKSLIPTDDKVAGYDKKFLDFADGKEADAIVYVTDALAQDLEFARRQDIPVDEHGTLGDIADRKVHYDSKEEQGRSLVKIASGLLCRAGGEDVDTKDSSAYSGGNGVEIFVVSLTGELHMGSHKIGMYHHSSLLAGGAVAVGGEIKVTDGKIDWISNKSGHYKPDMDHLRQFLRWLQKDGVSLDFDVKDGLGTQGLVKATTVVDAEPEFYEKKLKAVLAAYKARYPEIDRGTGGPISTFLATMNLEYTKRGGLIRDMHAPDKKIDYKSVIKALKDKFGLPPAQGTV